MGGDALGQEGQLGLRPFDVKFIANDGSVRQCVVLAATIEEAFEFVWDAGEELEVGGGGIKDLLSISPSSLPSSLIGVKCN